MEELQKELRSLGGLTIAGVSPFNHPDASGTHRINTGANQNDEYNFVLNDYQDWAADAVNPDDVYFNDYLLDFNMEKDSLHPYHHEHAHWDFQENLKAPMQKNQTREVFMGATINEFERIISLNIASGIELENAKGRITDTDFAIETAKLAKNQIASQAGIAMAAQANAAVKNIMQLIN